ncbi:MAG: hypothetical protein ACOC6L_03960 [Thermodesulfobacteriota bacterium]
MIIWLLIGLAVGIYIGYKYPEQVTRGVEKSKQTANDLKDKFTKKDTPPKS